MEYIEEDRRDHDHDIREIGFWTPQKKIVAAVVVVAFVALVGLFLIVSVGGSDGGSSDDGDNGDAPIDDGGNEDDVDDGNGDDQPPVDTNGAPVDDTNEDDTDSDEGQPPVDDTDEDDTDSDEGQPPADVSASWGPNAPEWTKNAIFSPSDFHHCFVDDISDTEPAVALCWKVTSPPQSRENRREQPGINEEEITFGVVAPALHDRMWLGLGLSANGGMYGADIVTFSPHLGLQDRFSTAWAKPGLDDDGLVNVFLEGGEIRDGAISFVFRRPVRVCDDGKEQDFDIIDSLNNVIWASGIATDTDITYHISRGSVLLDLLSRNDPPSHEIHAGAQPDSHSAFGEQVDSFEFLMGDSEGDALSLADYTSGTDTYLCKMFAAPEIFNKQHILEVDAVVEHTQYVHHMILYHCLDIDEEENAHWFEPGECRMACPSVAAAWAVGGYSRFHFPAHVGFPFGDVPGKKDYFRLEIHYNTVSRPGPNVEDKSGFRIRYGEPREFDAGTFFFGWDLGEQFQMPAGKALGSPETTWESYIPEECWAPVFGEEGIHVFSSMFHMHQFGRSSVLQRYRNGREIEPFDQLDYYDFNYQRIVPTSQTILPSDTLKLTCRYDTTTATETVHSGEGSGDEMCFYFLTYYPRHKQLDQGFITLGEDDTSQQVYCNRGVKTVDKTKYEQQPEYVPPARKDCE